MKTNTHTLITGALALAAVTTLLTGCNKKGDAISGADQSGQERRASPRPALPKAKAIAEDGFIYGLPLVMNYAVMNEFAVDTKSSQFKAPFNEINNQHRVFTYEDTAVITPNSDTPYSMLLAGSARRADGGLGTGGAPRSATTRCS